MNLLDISAIKTKQINIYQADMYSSYYGRSIMIDAGKIESSVIVPFLKRL